MKHPWGEINLETYESHMSSETVYQLQTLNEITKQQLNDYEHSKVAILGIAGGNGLENIDLDSTVKVYGFDVNQEYLDKCKIRYSNLDDILELICCDLSNIHTILPSTNILIGNLIIEYLGMEKFVGLVKNNKNNIEVISCVIQKNNSNSFVSSSNLDSAFAPIMAIHNDIIDSEFINAMREAGFECIKKNVNLLPNGKEFIRLDFI